jgi:transcriptional regulator with PAS, ATPase and Fis domain
LAAAEGGSLFLDEIDSLSLKSQAALLRVLQEKEYRPIGSNDIQTANSRLIAATNHNLPDLIHAGRFREDLYYRLLILNIHMPPLRERSEDIETLVASFIIKLNKEYGLDCDGVSQQVLDSLCQHSWPGNVRELENTIHRLYLTKEGRRIDTLDDLQFGPDSIGGMPQTGAIPGVQTCAEADLTFSEAKRKAIEAFEHTFVRQVLDVTNGNVTKAATLCGKERRAFGKLVKKYKINKECSAYI